MISGLSTHVLDTSSGRPAAGVPVTLFLGDKELGSATTNADGRIASLLPTGVDLQAAAYRLVFDVGAYFPHGFYPKITIDFLVRDAGVHYHVPVLMSPFGYSTYRGS